MTEHEAILRAVSAAPDDDQPRRVAADWLEEQGDAAQAEFIRMQLELAQLPLWAPQMVRVKHRRPELLTGQPWLHTLPQFNAGLMEWNARGPFHRGFGTSLHVRQLSAFLDIAPQLLEIYPIAELILPDGTRDDWHRLLSAPWLANIRSVRFTFGANLIEPVRALAASDYATGLQKVAFDVCTSPAMGVIVEALVQSPLARNLQTLDFSLGNDIDSEIAEQLASVELPNLRELSFTTMSLGDDTWKRLLTLQYTARVKNIAVVNQQFDFNTANVMCQLIDALAIEALRLENCECRHADLDDGNHEQGWNLGTLITPALRSLELRKMHLHNQAKIDMTQVQQFARFHYQDGYHRQSHDWRQMLHMLCSFELIELDVRGNAIADEHADLFLEMMAGERLVAIVLDAAQLTEPCRQRLRAHFGDRLVLRETSRSTLE